MSCIYLARRRTCPSEERRRLEKAAAVHFAARGRRGSFRGKMARPWIVRALVLCCWLASSVNAECGVTPAQIDFTGSNVSLIMLDAEGSETNWPFPGGSVRWTNVGTALIDDSPQAYDVLVIEQEGSTRPYTQPGASSSAAALSGGFACLNVGVTNSSCTNGGVYDSNWTPAQPLSEACSTGGLQSGGAQFTFRFVKTGTTELMPAFDLIQVWASLPSPCRALTHATLRHLPRPAAQSLAALIDPHMKPNGCSYSLCE